MNRKTDPSRTKLLRDTFQRDVTKRLNQLWKAIKQVVLTEDGFGLKSRNANTTIVSNTRFAFTTDEAKVKAFREWLDEQVKLGLLETDAVGEPWNQTYIRSTYKKAVLRSYTEVRREVVDQPAGFYEGSKAEFLREAFDSPIAVDKIKLLSTRTFENLKGFTNDMGSRLNRITADGISHGHSPRKIARAIKDQLSTSKARALTIARTEIIHAHAEGQLDSFERLGVKEVGVMAEWSTAGDDRVCPQCQPLDGSIMTVKEARGLIPLHPNCRCAWIPSIPETRKK